MILQDLYQHKKTAMDCEEAVVEMLHNAFRRIDELEKHQETIMEITNEMQEMLEVIADNAELETLSSGSSYIKIELNEWTIKPRLFKQLKEALTDGDDNVSRE